jgi:hypothetical protein
VGKPTAIEAATLTEAEALLRFAAEHVRALPPEYAQTFAEARAAAEEGTWTSEISRKFWEAFAKLCDLIQPVNIDCLTTAQTTVTMSRWWGLRRGRRELSLAERSSTRYFRTLLGFLIVLIMMQLYVWMCTSLSKRIDDLITTNLSLSSRLASQDYSKLEATPNAAGQSLVSVRSDINLLKAEVERIRFEVKLLDKVASAFVFPHALEGEEEPGGAPKAAADPAAPVKKITQEKDQLREEFQNARQELAEARLMALQVQEKESLIVGTLVSFVLPVWFGTIGALAYVIRTISDQIKRSTFAQSSPIRHQMRVALGALAGVVIGLFNSGLSTQVNLSPLAWAFLAGYGVEAVFSFFDALVDKFKQPSPTQIEVKK